MKLPQELTMSAIAAEVSSARIKFPAPNKNMTALTEEVGELAKALLEYDGTNRDEIEKEAVQVATMAIRVLEEGDPTLGVPPLRSFSKATESGLTPCPACGGRGRRWQHDDPGFYPSIPCPECE